MKNTMARWVCGWLVAVVAFATYLQGEMAISFNGVQGYVNLYTPAAVQIDSNAPFTVEALVCFRSLSTRDMIYTKSSGRTASYDYILGFADNTMAAWDGSAYRGNIPVERELNRWYHVAFVCDGTYLSFYFDGVYRGNCLFSFSNTTSYNAKIGGHLNNMDVDGFMSEVRLWDHARSAGEIFSNRNKRIKSGSSGLRGYWPLNEGTGTTAFDMSGGGSDGTIVGGTWYDVASLELLTAEGFVWGETFALRDPLSKSTRFTGGTIVEMVPPTVSALYDSFQITQQETVDSLQPGEWQSLANLPQELSFSQPVADTNINFYLWLTNQNTEVVLQCRQGTIIYTAALPQPSVRLARPLVSSQTSMVIKPLEVNSGSTGGVTAGTTAGESIEVTGLHLRLLEGPGVDLTPESPWVTVDTAGSYTVELIVSNVIGNVATSMAAVVTLTRTHTPALKFSGSSSYADMGGREF